MTMVKRNIVLLGGCLALAACTSPLPPPAGDYPELYEIGPRDNVVVTPMEERRKIAEEMVKEAEDDTP